MPNFDLVENDTGVALEVACVDKAGVKLPLEGCSAILNFKIGNGAMKSRTMSVYSLADSLVRYYFDPGDLDDSGNFVGEVKIVSPDGTFIKSLDVITLRVRRAMR